MRTSVPIAIWPAAPSVRKHRHGIFVNGQIAIDAPPLRRHDAGHPGDELNPLRTGRDRLLAAGKGREPFGGPVDFGRQLSQQLIADPSILELLGGGEEPLESSTIAVADRADDFGGDFLGGDLTPLVDPPVFVPVNAPAGPAGRQPAVLVGLLVLVGIDVTVDFHAVPKIAPTIDPFVVIGVDESPQDLAGSVVHLPAGPSIGFDIANDARFDLIGGDLFVVHIGLDRLQPQGAGGRGVTRQRARGGRGGQRGGQQQALGGQGESVGHGGGVVSSLMNFRQAGGIVPESPRRAKEEPPGFV